MCSVCEHSEHALFVHCPNTVIAPALTAHPLITMSIHARLPIITSTAVLYYPATLCSIYTAESDRNSTHREQTLSFGATMHDFSGWSGLVVLQPKQGNIKGTLFSRINLATRRRLFYCLLTMVRKNESRKKRKGWLRTLIIYPARRIPKSDIKGKMLRPQS